MFKKLFPLFLALTILVSACAPSAREVAVELATLQAAQAATVVAPPATSAPSADAGFSGPTTEEAKKAIGLDVQRLRTEPSAFVWRGIPNSTFAKCPNADWVCTMHLVTNDVKLFKGDGTSYNIVAGTWRYIKGYQSNDAVYHNPPCNLLKKEQDFGAKEVPSFPVVAGNFTCPTATSAALVVTRAPAPSGAALSCPSFGGVTTTPGNDGSPFCKYKGTPIKGKVPDGYKAEYWDHVANVIRYAGPGEEISTVEATFRRP